MIAEWLARARRGAANCRNFEGGFKKVGSANCPNEAGFQRRHLIYLIETEDKGVKQLFGTIYLVLFESTLFCGFAAISPKRNI